MERHPLQVSSRTATLSHILLLWNVADVKPYVQNKKVAAAAFLGTLCATHPSFFGSVGLSTVFDSFSLVSRVAWRVSRVSPARRTTGRHPKTWDRRDVAGIRDPAESLRGDSWVFLSQSSKGV